MGIRILLIEDDVDLGNVLKHFLNLHSMVTEHITSGKDAGIFLKKGSFDLCILDVMLPDIDGFSIAKEIKNKNPQLPFIFLTARSMVNDRINGLRLGAEDYITKPFEPEELLLRIKNTLKRNNFAKTETISIGSYTFERENLLLYNQEFTYNLTEKEAEVLFFLTSQANQLVRKSDILKKVWGKDDYFLGRSLDVFISRLRKYFSTDTKVLIENIRGIGFRFNIFNK